MNLKDVAAIAGKSGLYKVIKPTRTGVILESIDEQKVKIIANSNTRVSILKEISMYTTGADASKALEDIFAAVFKKYALTLPISPKADGADLGSFLESVLPDYDKEKVYLSDIKKLVTWYTILAQYHPETFTAAPEVELEPIAESVAETVVEKPVAKKASAKKKEA